MRAANSEGPTRRLDLRHRAEAQAAFWVLAYVGFRLAAPKIIFLPAALATALAAAISMVLSLLMVVSFAGMRLPAIADATVLAISGGAWLISHGLHVRPWDDVFVVLSGVFLGRIVARVVRHPNLILPIGVAAALVDVWGVNLHGPMARVLEKSPQTVAKFAAKVPTFGAPGYVALIGIGDFVFLALLFACLSRFDLNVKGAVIASAVALSLGMVLVTGTNLRFNLPGLPFIVIGVLVPNWRRFRFTREESFALAYAGAALVAVLGLATWLLRLRFGP